MRTSPPWSPSPCTSTTWHRPQPAHCWGVFRLLSRGFCFFALAIQHTFRVDRHIDLRTPTRASGARFIASSMPNNSKFCYLARYTAFAPLLSFPGAWHAMSQERVTQLELFTRTFGNDSSHTLATLPVALFTIAKPAVYYLARAYVRRGTAERNLHTYVIDAFHVTCASHTCNTLPVALGKA
eukprot:5147676-Amphidinium_carterae.1